MNKTSVPFIATAVWAAFGIVAMLVGKPILNIWWHLVPFLYMLHATFMATLFDIVLKETIPAIIAPVVEEKLQEVLSEMDDSIQDLVIPASDDHGGYPGGYN